MSKLSSGLETIDYGQQLWQSVFNTNAQREDFIFNKISGFWDGTATDGKIAVWNNTSGKVVPSDPPYPVPQSAVAVTIGGGADTTINATLSKFYTRALSKDTNLLFTNLSSGMVLNIVVAQDATGGRNVTASGCTIVGTINTTSLVNTWLRCYKVGTSTFIEVLASFIV